MKDLLSKLAVGVCIFVAGFIIGWGSKPQVVNSDRSWNLFHASFFSPPSWTQVGALRPPYWHFSQYRLRCSDCSTCHPRVSCNVTAILP